jgi:hypothetical protein
MTDALNQTLKSVVLHIADSAVESSEAVAVEQWIGQAGMEVGRCPDVYLGLARVLGNTLCDLRAVIVCVENLSPDEFEFFSLLGRARRELPVFVYAARFPDRVVRALQSGAKGLATRDAMLALGASMERRVEQGEPALEPPPDAVRSSISSSTPAAPKDVDSKPAAGLIEDIEDGQWEDAEANTTTRVPWLRYSGGPERQRPVASKAEQEETSSTDGMQVEDMTGATAPHKCEQSYEPLLTEQELAALLGDDFDDVVAQEREMLTGDNEVPGSGTR